MPAGFLRKGTEYYTPENQRVDGIAKMLEWLLDRGYTFRRHRAHRQGDQLGQAEGGAQAEAAGLAQPADDEGGPRPRNQ